jgi:hypothetical protein
VETAETLQQALEQCIRWEREQKDLWFWEKLGRLPFVLLDKLTPAFIQEKLGMAVDELANYLENGDYLIDERAVLARFAKYRAKCADIAGTTPMLEEAAACPIAVMDAVADELRDSRATFATVQGATTGIGGLFTLALDIPLLVGTSLKVLQEMALCYGYDPREKKERLFIVKCLQFASSDIVGKKAIIDELSDYDGERKRTQTIAQLQGWREVIVTYTENFGWKKLFQVIPLAGILFGAYLNRSMIQDVAEAGKMLYRKRRILERLSRFRSPVNH